MSDAPWFRFFPSDWLNGTRGLSLAQIGLYITMVGEMYDHGGPLKMKRETLARRCGVTLRQVNDALDVLIEEGKVIETPDGFWNERVAREIVARDEKIQKAKNAAAVREERKIQSKQSEDLSDDDREIIGGSSILDSRYKNLEKEESCPKPAAPAPDLFVPEADPKPKKRTGYPPDFEAFWKSYPTDPNMSKAEAGKAWAKLDTEDRKRAAAAVPAFRKWVAKQGTDYRTLHAVRFITQKRFEGFAVTADGTAEIKIDWQKRVSFARKVKEWDLRNWGPMPHQPGCQAPPELLEPSDGQGWKEYRP